ncbi:RNA polymerase sigma factor [Microbacterium sp. G2-8]|uniref:RNA polymerase sigma factor n=1 Tax=Microbacterium sp. G2-8 TaxID=2842454 RepID=UPI001C890642|nr:sigma-70 family RNA polymerase sigma factor [Microbacterium sp. G2-8]
MEDDSRSAPSGGQPADSSASPPERAADGTADALGRSGERWARAAALFVRWRGGDPRAIDDLVRLMTPVLWHVVRAYGLRTSVAEDVIQTTWLTLVRKHESIDEPQAVSAWLTITARREAWRASKRDGRDDDTEDERLERLAPARRGVDHDVSESDERQHLWNAVARLDPRCQRLLRIIAFDERPDYAEISKALHMPVGSIGPTRSRCLAKLRNFLDAGMNDVRRGGDNA